MDQDATWQGGRPRPKGHCVRCGQSSPSPKGDRAPQIFGPSVLWPIGSMDQDGTWHGGGPRSRPQCARWGPSSSSPKKVRSPLHFRPSLLWPNGWMHQDAIGMEVGLSPADFVLDGDPSTPQKGCEAPSPPQFSAHFYCGQTARCIKMPLGINVGFTQETLC